MNKFMINFPGNLYSCELYSKKGDNIFSLEEAKEEAERQFPNLKWEVYNGIDGFMNEELMKDYE